jgi:hypothetical protein
VRRTTSLGFSSFVVRPLVSHLSDSSRDARLMVVESVRPVVCVYDADNVVEGIAPFHTVVVPA